MKKTAHCVIRHTKSEDNNISLPGQNKYVSMIREFKVRGQPKVHNCKCSYLL